MQFSQERLIEQVKEAEKLVNIVQMRLNGHELAVIRWLVVADEATTMIQQAEEHLTEEELASLRTRVNAIKPDTDLWQKYKDNPRRAKAFFGHELYEQPGIEEEG